MMNQHRGLWMARGIAILLVLMGCLVACSEPVVEVGSEPVASPTSSVLAVGRLACGESFAGLSLVGTSAGEWTLQASVSFPDAAGVEQVSIVTTRSDQPGAEQNIVQRVLDNPPVLLSLTLPHIPDGDSVLARVNLQRGEVAQPLGHVKLEAASDHWFVVELVSGESAGEVYAEGSKDRDAVAHEESPATEPAEEAHHAEEVEETPPPETPVPPTATLAPARPEPQPTATLAPLPTSTPPATAYIVRIREPVNDEYVIDSVTVRGEALAFENLVTVQVLDAMGNVLEQQQVLANAIPGEAGPFEVVMQFPQVRFSQYGFVHAYVTDPHDGNIAAETSVRVNLHGSQDRPTAEPALPSPTPKMPPALVEIIEPPDGAVVRGSVTVRGNGRAFENSLVVQVREFSGRVLGESIAQIDAGLGQVGPWQAQVQVTGLVIARQGQIYVYAINPEDGTVQADDMVEVWLAGSGSQ